MKFAPYITIYDFDESLDLQNEVIWTFSSFLKGISSTRHRFNIHVVGDLHKERQHLEGSIKSVSKYVPIDMSLDESKNEEKEFLLELITNCFLDVAIELGWDQNSIIEAKEKSIMQNIDFQYSSKPVKNKTGQNGARIDLQLIKNKVSIWVVFSSNSDQDLIKNHLIDTPIEQISFFRSFPKPNWINNSQFGFRFKNGMALSVSVEKNEIVWSQVNSKMEELFKKQIDFNEKLSPEELVELANC
jgi:hypothetical protein